MEWADLEGTKIYQTGSDERRARIRAGWEKDFSADYPETVAPVRNPKRTFLKTLGDVGVTAAKSVVGLGDAAIGIADIPTMGYAGKFIEDTTGYESDKVQSSLEKYYSDAQQIANEKVDAAEGFVDTVKTSIQNPSTIGHTVLESLPMMLGGAGIARGLLKAGKVASPYIAAAIGEGVIGAGSSAESIRQQTDAGILTPKQAAMAVGSGIGTGAFGFAGSRLAKRFGLADVDVLLAAGKFAEKSSQNVIKRIIGGGISEGVFEELPQSTQEQVWMNAALGNPLTEDVGKSAAIGMLAGALPGGLANIASQGQSGEKRTQQEIDIDKKVTDILTQDKVGIDQSLQQLNDDIKLNQAILNDEQKFDAQVVALNIEPTALAEQLLADNARAKSLLDQVNTRIAEQEKQVQLDKQAAYDKLSPEEKAVKDVEKKLQVQRDKAAQKEIDNDPERKALQDDLLSNILDTQRDVSDQDAIKSRGRNFEKLQADTLARNEGLAPARRKFNIEKDQAEQELIEKNLASLESNRQSTPEETAALLDQVNTNIPEADIPEILNAERSAEAFLAQRFTEAEKVLIEDYWQGVKQALNLRQEEITPGTEVAMKKRFFETKLAEIEGNVQQDTEASTNANQKVTISLAEQNKRQAWFQQTAEELGDFPTTNIQKIEREQPRPTQPFTDEQQVGAAPQFQVGEDKPLSRQEILSGINDQTAGLAYIDSKGNANWTGRKITPNMWRKLEDEGHLEYVPLDDIWVAANRYNKETGQIIKISDLAQLQTTDKQEVINQVNLTDIEKVFLNQTVSQAADGTISVRFKNGKGLMIKSMQNAGQGFIKMAIETGQMAKNGQNILGITVGNEILLDDNFADNKTLWHENKHVLDNLGMITTADNSALNKEFNKLRKQNKLDFALSTAKDPKTGKPDNVKRMAENRANMFAQIMVNREIYRNTSFGKVIQRVMDFFQQMLAMGQQSISGLAREVESGKIYERTVNNQTYQTTVPQAEVTAATWYSALENAVNSFKAKQAPAKQWKQMIGQYVKNKKGELIWKGYPGVKPEEVEWMGLYDWLDEQDGKVTRDELVAFIQQNNIRLEEVVKADERSIISIINAKINPLGYAYDQHYDDEWVLTNIASGEFVGIDEAPKNVQAILNDPDNFIPLDPTEHSTYQLAGGKNYKEFIITAPNRNTSMNDDAQEMFGKSFEELNSDEGMQLQASWDRKDKRYKSAHWPGITNPLVHIRFNERTDAEGNRVLFLEEIQSDWHQEGRREGYNKQVDTSNWRIEATGEKNARGRHLYKLYDGDIFKNDIASILSNPETLLQKLKDRTPTGVPNAPFKKSTQWSLLAMKRMVKYAAENGFDKIAWTTGQQQVDRYGKDNINAEGMKAFYDKILPNTFNKEFNRGKWGKVKVEVSDIGMQADIEISKEYALDAFDAGKMIFLDEKIAESKEEILNFNHTDITTVVSTKQLSLPITDRMKSKVLREGMAMFQLSDIPISQQVLGGLINKKTATGTKAFKDWFEQSVTKTKQGDPVIFYHGTDEVFEEFTKDTGSKSAHITANLGHFFTMQKGLAEKYGQHQVEAYLKMERPYKMSLAEAQSFDTFEQSDQRKAALQSEGYDSIVIETGASPYVIIFDSGQAKSIYNQGDWNDPSNIYFEVREQAPEQKISNAEYDKVYTEKNSLLKGFAQQARIKFTEARLIADKAMGPISTRLGNVDPELPEALRGLDFDTSQRIIAVLKVAQKILDVTNGKKNIVGVRSGGMTPQDKSAWNWARLQADKGKIEQLAQKYGLTEDLVKLREELNQIREDAKKVGYDVGFIDEYWPRAIKDREGFLQATEGISQDPPFTNAFRAQAKKLGITQEQFEREFPEARADIISNLILGQPTGIAGPGNIKSRVFETIPDKYAKFYMDADASLMQYVYSMTKKIEARKFFGKVPKRISDLKSSKKQKTADLIKFEQLADMARAENPEALAEHEKKITSLNEDLVVINEQLNLYDARNNYKENIGVYIDRMMTDGRIQKKDEKMVRDILDARFHEQGTHGLVGAIKNAAYIDVMGNPLSAITQIGDLAWAMYVGKVWTPKGFSDTIKHTTQAIFKKSDITKEDLGFERIAQEFADGTTLGKAVSKVFKMVGLEQIDSIGKEVLINNALSQYKAEAKNDFEALIKKLKPIFKNESADLVQELLAYNPSDVNSNPSGNIKRLLYSRVLDFQPVALSEMPEWYLNSGNARIAWMLKTYTMKQFDVFRREVIHNIKSENPQQKIQGMKNMVQLMSLLVLANATADEIKDFMLGKETRFSDNLLENLLTMGGASKYTKMQVSREGFGSALAQQILPPMKFINSASKDMLEGYKDYVSGDTSNFDHARIIDSIPVAGKLYYWHYGRGDENRKSLAEKDFAEAAKDTRLFKKQLGNADDKRLFIESNLDRFKQVQLQENFQKIVNKKKADINQLEKIYKDSLKRNGAVINKLERVTSTENVQTRLGQLKAQREQILKRYFEVAESI